MNYTRQFHFSPGEAVTIIAFGLDYPGVVERCIWRCGDDLYVVEYAVDGKIETREFYQRQLRGEQ